MRNTHDPKQPCDLTLQILGTYTVLPEEGRVISPEGYEYCAISEYTKRVMVYVGLKGILKPRSIFRYHVVWWKATGKWPTLTIHHLDDIPNHDWFSNLVMVTIAENNAFKTKGHPRKVYQAKPKDPGSPWLNWKP